MASSGCSLFVQLYLSFIVLVLPWQPETIPAASTVSDNCTLLTIQAETRVAQVGSTVHLNCSLLGWQLDLLTPPYNASDVEWFHNGNNLVPGVGNQATEAGTSQVTLERVGIEQGGRYSCCLKASCAEEACVASLDILIGWPPESARELECSSNNFRNANCTWTRGGQHSNLPTTDVLESKEQTASGSWELCSDSMDAICTPSTCYLYCARASMNNSYRVHSSNELGTVYSNEIFFDLDKETIISAPSNVKVTNISSSSLHVHWSLPLELARIYNEEQALRLIGFCLQYKWEGSLTINKTKVDRMDYTINNLMHPYGLYQVKVGAYVKHGIRKCWNFSKKVFGRTTEVAPVNYPGNFTCNAVVSKNQSDIQLVNLTWKAVPNEYKQNGEVLGYLIVVHNQNLGRPITNVTVGPNITSHTIQGLQTSRQYNVSIQTRNSMGLSDANWCHAPAVPPGVSLVLVFVSVAVLCGILVVVCLAWGRLKYKKSVGRWQAVTLPAHLLNNNITYRQGATLVREREVFDEVPHPDLVHPDTVHSDNRQGVGSVGLEVHRCTWGERSLLMPLELQDRGQANGGFDSDSASTVSPGYTRFPGHRIRYPSSEASSPTSPLSVASGGSYMILKDPAQGLHSHVLRESLSPVDRDRQRLGSDQSPGLIGKDDAAGLLLSRFVWDEGVLDKHSPSLGMVAETGRHPLGSPASLSSSHQCPNCQAVSQGKREAPDESQTDASITGENRSPGRRLVPVAAEDKEGIEEQREPPGLPLDGMEPSVIWDSHPNVPRSDAGRPKKELLMESRREANLAACLIGSENLHVEGAPACDHCKTKSPISLSDSIKTSEGSVWLQWSRDTCLGEGFLSDQEPLLSPNSTVSSPTSISESWQGSGPVKDYKSLNYVSVCTDGSDEEEEEEEGTSQLDTYKPLCDSDAPLTQRDNSQAEGLAKGISDPHHQAAAASREKSKSLVVSGMGGSPLSEGYCRMDQVGSKQAPTEEGSTAASYYYEMKPISTEEFNETLDEGRNQPGGSVGGEQDPLSPGSSISSPLSEDGRLQEASLVKDYDSLNYVTVCMDGSDEEQDEQQTSEASQSLHTPEASAVQEDLSLGTTCTTSSADRLAGSDNRPKVALSPDEGFEEDQDPVA